MSKQVLTDADKHFYQGFACALASLARGLGPPSMAIDIMNTNGITLADLEKAGVEEFDLKPLRAEWRES